MLLVIFVFRFSLVICSANLQNLYSLTKFLCGFLVARHHFSRKRISFAVIWEKKILIFAHKCVISQRKTNKY